MTIALTHIALLRAVNVGGTGLLPMARLRELAQQLGFAQVRTLLASGNLIFESELSSAAAASRLTQALATEMGKPVEVVMRRPAELDELLAANPFPDAASNRLLATLFNADPLPSQRRVLAQKAERLHWGERVLWIDYREGMADSKLRLPDLPEASRGTARNLNTLRKLQLAVQGQALG